MHTVSRTILLALVLLVANPAGARSQATSDSSYPNRMVRLVVPLGAGSVTDILARALAEKLTAIWGQQVIVENKPGIPGIASAAGSPPDGYTLLVNSNGHTIAGAVYKNLSFDPAKDFAGVTQLVSVPQTLIVPPDLPTRTVGEFVALAKQKPGQLNFGSLGVASAAFLGAQLFKHAAKIDIVHVPYKSSPEAITSIIRGDSHLYYLSVNLAIELHNAGKVRAIAVSTQARSQALPDVPTVAESGLPEYKFDSWFGVLAPAGVPPAILAKVQRDIAKVLKLPDVTDRLTKLGFDIVGNAPDEFDAMIKSDTARNTAVLRELGVAPD